MRSLKTYLPRYLWFLAGVLINSFGVALITRAALGTSPISSLPYVLSFRFPVTLGQFTFAMNLFFILGQVLLLRRDFQPIQLLQVAVNAVFSAFIGREHGAALLAGDLLSSHGGAGAGPGVCGAGLRHQCRGGAPGADGPPARASSRPSPPSPAGGSAM